MKSAIYTIEGKKGKEITLPSFFSTKVREDLIQKIVESKKIKQPYAPSPLAGNQYSASGKLKHHRKVWKSQYGRGMSRVPRKQMTRRGSQFHWVGATVPNTRGGRRAHPPKILSMLGLARLNKKESKLGLMSSLSATANEKYVLKKYASLEGKKIENLPIILETKFVELKLKEFLNSLSKILGKDLYEIALPEKTQRAGRGKMRGRKYKKNRGFLLVLGKDEKFKTKRFETQNVQKLGVKDLAEGGVGRLVIYTEKAIKDLEEKLK